MSDERKKIAVLLWASAAPVVLAGYLLGMGPISWLGAHGWLPEWLDVPIRLLYFPVELVHENGPEPMVKTIDWYIGLWN